MPIEDLEWALAEHRESKRRRAYERARDYYEGRHPLAFAVERFNTVFGKRLGTIHENLCAGVVDAITDRLRINSFSSTARRGNVDQLGPRAWAIWERNRMGQRAKEAHRNALRGGDGYVIVWPDRERRAAIWPQEPEEMVVEYSEEVPGEILRAARVWREATGDKRRRVTIYLPDRIERWATSPDTRATLSVKAFGLLEGDDAGGENPYGRVPVFHFPNKRLFGYGVGELVDVFPLQDGLNKAIADLLVAMEYSSYRQRWATGVETGDEETEAEGDVEGGEETTPAEPVMGVDRLITAENEQARFGDFNETDLSQFLEVQDAFVTKIARVTDVPLHYLLVTRGGSPGSRGDARSGEAMKSSEARFTAKLEDRHESWGNTWEDALMFALLIEGARLPKTAELATVWKEVAPRSEEELARTALMKRKLGVSRRQLLKEQGYTDELITEMFAEDPVDENEELEPEEGQTTPT